MNADLKPYPATKESDVPWLREVPEHWEVRRLRNAAEMRVSNVDKHNKEDEQPVRLCNYVDVYKNDRIRNRMAFMRATAAMGEIARFRLQAGDVLITKDSEAWNDIGVPALVEESADDLICGYHLALLRPFADRLLSGYLFRALQSTAVAYQCHVEAHGVTRYGLSHSAIKSVWLPIPPLPEQAAIVRFLDHVDRRIRRYIRAKQKLIKLLEEQKQAIIQRAVTRGLNLHVGLKPSGVEWLGDVPEHWDVRRLKSLVGRIDQGVSPQNYMADDGSWGVLKAGCVNRGVFRETQHKRLPPGFEIEPDLAVAIGDVLVSRASGSPHFVGSTGRVVTLNYRLILSDKTFRPIFIQGVDSDFMVLAMNSRYYRQQVEQAISGAGGLANNLPLSSLRAFRFLIPPTGEQRKIVVDIGESTGDVVTTIEREEGEISLLREYRTRLIADVVTGKLDVREAAVRLPNEPEEEEPLDEADALTDADEDAADDLDAVPEEAEA